MKKWGTWAIVAATIVAFAVLILAVAFALRQRRRKLERNATKKATTQTSESQMPSEGVLQNDGRSNREVAEAWVDDLWDREKLNFVKGTDFDSAAKRVRWFQNAERSLNRRIQKEAELLPELGYTLGKRNHIEQEASDLMKTRLRNLENAIAIQETF